MAYTDPDVGRQRDRDARLRTAGKPRRNRQRARAYERQRAGRQAAERRAAGICVHCGKVPAAEGGATCAPCAEKRRARERVRYAKAKADGQLYGGRRVATCWRIGRERSRKRDETRRAAGLCTACGKRPPVEGGSTCEPCRIARQASKRETYAARRATEVCVKCAGPVNDGGARCAPCSVLESERGDRERRNARRRELYWLRRARSECTNCGAPSQGAARRTPCAEKSYHGSGYFKGIPAWDLSFTVLDLASGDTLGCFDSEAEVAAALVFAKLSFDQVEVISDASPMARYAAWT